MKTTKPDKHVECVSDFCGNHKDPGAWADIFERPDGTRYIGLGGAWLCYAEQTPEFIEEDDPHFQPFLDACEKCEDFGYAKEHWDTSAKTVEVAP